jgi:hypothetical protein
MTVRPIVNPTQGRAQVSPNRTRAPPAGQRGRWALVLCHSEKLGLVIPLESRMMRATRRPRMNEKYIVRLTDQERDERAAMIKKFQGTSQQVRRAQILSKADVNGPNGTDQLSGFSDRAYGSRRYWCAPMSNRPSGRRLPKKSLPPLSGMAVPAPMQDEPRRSW